MIDALVACWLALHISIVFHFGHVMGEEEKMCL